MKQEILTVKSNDALTKSVYRLRLEGDLSSFTRPGQFCNIALPGFYLRRPISVCDIEDGVPIGFPDIVERERRLGKKVAAYPVSENDWMDMGQLPELEKMRIKLYGE